MALPPARSGEIAKRVVRKLEELSPDMVFLSGYGDPALRRARAYARDAGIPWMPVLTEAPSPAEGLKRILRREVIRRFLKGAVGLACMGPRAVQEYAGIYDGPMVDTPYAFDNAALLAHPRPRDRGPDGLTFLYSGRLIGFRQPLRTIEAFARFREVSGGLGHLIISGKGPLEEAVHAKVRELLAPGSFTFMNDFSDWDDLMNLYRSADVLLSANAYSTWNLTVQEAMASGMGVISTWTTDAAAALVVNEFNGFLVRPNHTGDIVGAMRHYLEDPNLAHCHGQRSREMVASVDAAAVAQRLGRFLTEVVLANGS